MGTERGVDWERSGHVQPLGKRNSHAPGKFRMEHLHPMVPELQGEKEKGEGLLRQPDRSVEKRKKKEAEGQAGSR